MTSGKKSPDQTQSSFKVDHDATGVNDMPSVTRLLNRKKLGIEKPQTPPMPPLAPPPAFSEHTVLEVAVPPSAFEPSTEMGTPLPPLEPPMEITLSPELSSAEIQSAPSVRVATVTTARKRASAPLATPLIEWTKATLVAGQDPLGRGLLAIIALGATSGLFLAGRSGPTGKLEFVATATFAPGKRRDIWLGVKTQSDLFPELWQKLLGDGLAEFSPPGQATDIGSLRNLVRSAFGALETEWMTVLRVGSPTYCRGILILFSKTSLRAQAADALKWIHSSVVVKQAA